MIAEPIAVNLKTPRRNNTASRVQKGVRVSDSLTVSAAELRPRRFAAAGGTGTVYPARLRTLDAGAVVAGVTGDAGVAPADGGADAVGGTQLAVLQVEEVALRAHVVGSCGGGGEGEEDEEGEEGEHG